MWHGREAVAITTQKETLLVGANEDITKFSVIIIKYILAIKMTHELFLETTKKPGFKR